MLRASGVKWDLRKAQPYANYKNFDFEIPTGQSGDTYDRYLVRMVQMRQSAAHHSSKQSMVSPKARSWRRFPR